MFWDSQESEGRIREELEINIKVSDFEVKGRPLRKEL
jgi:hypothetical protein